MKYFLISESQDTFESKTSVNECLGHTLTVRHTYYNQTVFKYGGMLLGRNKELLYKVCKFCLPGILLVVVVRQASFARCFSASEACGSAVYEGGGAGSFVDGGQV